MWCRNPIYTQEEELIDGYKANVRDSDRSVLGVVTDRYKIVQNREAFAFTDELLGGGGALRDCRKFAGRQESVAFWHTCRHEYIISGEHISPYLLFSNAHDGERCNQGGADTNPGSVQNTLNLALNTARRSWSMNHTGNIEGKMKEARDTLFMAETYMDELGKEFEGPCGRRN